MLFVQLSHPLVMQPFPVGDLAFRGFSLPLSQIHSLAVQGFPICHLYTALLDGLD